VGIYARQVGLNSFRIRNQGIRARDAIGQEDHMTQTVAVLGTGRMGAGMARTLRQSGFDVVVYNRTAESAQALAGEIGAIAAPTAREAAAAADVVISSLADDVAVRDVFAGPDGAPAGLRQGTVVLEMSTIDPATVAEIALAIEAAGGTLIDAPVSGSVALVEQGALTVMAGGSRDAMAKARPVLETLAAKVYETGDLGSGATVKLAVNAIVHAVSVAVAEALVLAEKAGVDRATAYEVFANSAVGSPFIEYKQAAFLNSEETPVDFPLDLVAKDLELILGFAERLGVDMVQSTATRAVTENAIAAGIGDRDMSAVADYLRR
jgi:3-hydroxyisobutyrate dehydrogenase-like beta-hydroxyacid dehydrogenase